MNQGDREPAAARPARADERHVLSEALADAFDDDPVMRFIVPGTGDRYRSRLARLFRIELAMMQPRGATWAVDDPAGATGVGGAAVWAPPNQWRETTADVVRAAIPALRVFGRHLRTGLAVLSALEAVHPSEPHWYLSTIGTTRQQQGRGLGGALMRAGLARCDADGLPAYLESSKPENVPYYRRFGFEPGPSLTLPGGGPVVIPMWREPEPPR